MYRQGRSAYISSLLQRDGSGCLLLLQLFPERADTDEKVNPDDHPDDGWTKMVEIQSDEVSDDTNEIIDERDDGEDDPGHQKAGLARPGSMDEHGCNHYVAHADNAQDRHHHNGEDQCNIGHSLGIISPSPSVESQVLVVTEA